MIIKRKLFRALDKLSYKNKWQRLGDAVQGTLGGTLYGGIAGGMMGILGGIKGMRTGAIIGASIGALLGTKLGWNSGSKKSIDRENKIREGLRNRVNNPEKYIHDLFKYDKSIIYELKSIEAKYDIKFSKDLYKLLQVRKQFSNQIIDWYKKYSNDVDSDTRLRLLDVPKSIMYDIFPDAIGADLEVSIDENNPNCAVLIDPSQADDTFIVYFTKTKTYGFDIAAEDGKYNSLKSAIIDLCKDNIDFCKEYKDEESNAVLDLWNKWMKFISQKL